MVYQIPYGSGSVEFSSPQGMEVEWIEPQYGAGALDPAALILKRLRNPIGARPLAAQARGARRVTIIVDDITRPTPSRQMLPPILQELDSAGVPVQGIQIVVGVGSHRKMLPEEMQALVGPDIFSRYVVLNHEAREPEQLVALGNSPRRIPVRLNRQILESDLCIITGFIKPHNVAGYSGGYKGYFPATAGLETIVGVHALQQLPGEPCRVGEIDNPFRIEVDAMGAMVPTPTFILNVIINCRKQIVDAFAGHPMKAHRAAVAETEKRATVGVMRAAPIVVASGGGYPSDISLYQGINALASVVRLRDPLVEPNGHVILMGEFREGLGSEFLGGGRHKDLGTAWASHLRKMGRLTVVSANVPREKLEEAGIRKADTLEDAIGSDDGHMIIMPHAPYTVGRLNRG